MSEAGQKAAKPKKGAGKPREINTGTQVGVGERARDPNYVPRFKKHYPETVRPAMMKKFGYSNPLQVPQLEQDRAEYRRRRGGRRFRRRFSRR